MSSINRRQFIWGRGDLPRRSCLGQISFLYGGLAAQPDIDEEVQSDCSCVDTAGQTWRRGGSLR